MVGREYIQIGRSSFVYSERSFLNILIWIQLLVELLQRGNNWIESGQLLARVHLLAGGDPLGDQRLDALYDDGLVLDKKVQFGGFLERKNIHVT